jgi:hypothetical protein
MILGQQVHVSGNPEHMPQDKKAIAEARALQACIQVTTDPVEQNRLWNRYYRLSDEVFPEAAVLRDRYKALEGEERRRFKTEYMELVRRLWGATDPQAAYPVSFSETPAMAPTPRYKPPQRRVEAHPRKSRRHSRLLFAGVITTVLAVGTWALWNYGESRKAALNSPVAVLPAAPDIPSAQPSPSEPGVAQVTPAAVSAPTETAAPEAAPTLGPPPEFSPPLEKIEAEVAQEILPAFTPIPEALRGKGDRIQFDGVEQADVYVIESDSLFYVRFPERGVVESVTKAGAQASISEDGESREALLAIWKQNREEIDRVASVREKEKASRLASYRKAYEAQLAQHKESEEEERWRGRVAEWLALGPEQRNVLRVRALGNWEAIQQDVDKVRELYVMISRAYAAIGITDERVGQLTSAYNAASRSRGPDYQVEDALIAYGWEREDWMRMVVEWETEYYRLNEYLTKNYPDIEKRVEEIKRLDDSLPAELRVAEATVNWDGALEPKSPSEQAGGSGTGFVVAPGIVMTCAHVVRGGTSVTVASGSGTALQARVHTLDMGNDWALLEVQGLDSAPIPVSVEKPNVGATIYCIGYPLGGIKDSTDPIVGSGNIAALQRLDGDQRFMQITAPINPGNSGGPVLDQYGRWVGVVSQKLNDMATLQAAETVTQGVNFAVKASFIQPLVQPKGGVELTSAPTATGQPLTLEMLVQKLAPSIVKIEVR